MWRIVKRHAKLSWAGTNPQRGLINLAKFVHWQVQHYYRRQRQIATAPDDDTAITRSTTAHALTSYAHKVIHIRTAMSVEALIKQILAAARHQ